MISRVLVVGAGPAGLATAAELKRVGVPYRLVEKGKASGHTWEHLYDSLTLHTGKHMSTLPGLKYPATTGLFPTRLEFLKYLHRYERANGLQVETGKTLNTLARVPNGWRAIFADGESADFSDVVMTSGIVASPRMPNLPGREQFGGRVMHSSEYLRPAPFVNQRVLVVGVGNSGGEIGAELARAGARVTVAVRSGANVVPKTIGPFPAQYVRYLTGKLPRAIQELIFARVQQRIERQYGPPVLPRPAHSALDAIPLIGFSLVEAIRDGLIAVKVAGLERYTPTGVRFSDGTDGEFDVVLLATGFQPALEPLGALVRRDAKGFALRTDRVTSADQPGLYFVGHNYDHTGGLTNIRQDAPLVASHLKAARVKATPR